MTDHAPQEDHQHSSPIKTPKQLAVVVVLSFVIPIAIIVLISQFLTGGMTGADTNNEAVVSARIAPVATVAVKDPNAIRTLQTGDQVFAATCKTCHEAGLAGAPKVGDKAAWAPRIAQGESTLFTHAIAGFTGKTGTMPAKGGNADLEDVEVDRAVVYMANASGGNLKEPAAPAPKPAAAAAPAAAPAAAAVAAAPVAVAAAAPAAAAPAAAPAPAADGKAVYAATCSVCHAAGIAGAPKFGDKAAWAPRIAEGLPMLQQHAIAGFQGKAGVMPPKGGNASLSDAAVKAAVEYMVAAAK